MPKTNAQRQREFRERKRKRNAPVTARIAEPTVTPTGTHPKDHTDGKDQIIYLGNWGYGDVFARVVGS